jgi:hypothetical protein
MVTAARAISVELLPHGPHPELTGADDMYIPTTQIRIVPDGAWHRRSAIATETACGADYFACAVRDYELVGELCPRCFTPRERWLATHPEDLKGDR